MKKIKREVNGVAITFGVLIIIFVSWFSFYSNDQILSFAIARDVVIGLLIGGFLIYRGLKGQSTKSLLMKEDISKFTPYPGVQFKDYVIFILVIFGSFLLFIFILQFLR